MYLEEDIQNNSKPLWLKKLENFYENCDNHDFEYTLNAYQASFKRNLLQDYEILDIIGSGSIGQVYLLQEKFPSDYPEIYRDEQQTWLLKDIKKTWKAIKKHRIQSKHINFR